VREKVCTFEQERERECVCMCVLLYMWVYVVILLYPNKNDYRLFFSHESCHIRRSYVIFVCSTSHIYESCRTRKTRLIRAFMCESVCLYIYINVCVGVCVCLCVCCCGCVLVCVLVCVCLVSCCFCSS